MSAHRPLEYSAHLYGDIGLGTPSKQPLCRANAVMCTAV